MKAIEYKTIDKSGWGRGVWANEPDKIQWRDDSTGLPCLIVRNGLGALCGYVGVAEAHRHYGKGYDDVGADVHGGLTFAAGCSDHSREAWVKWRAHEATWRAEAIKFPVGDSARRIKEWAGCFDDYEAWNERMIARSVCHIPDAGETDRIWWLGFDCAHLGDFIPGMRERRYPGEDQWYKDISYVRDEVTKLAAQLAERVRGMS